MLKIINRRHISKILSLTSYNFNASRIMAIWIVYCFLYYHYPFFVQLNQKSAVFSKLIEGIRTEIFFKKYDSNLILYLFSATPPFLKCISFLKVFLNQQYFTIKKLSIIVYSSEGYFFSNNIQWPLTQNVGQWPNFGLMKNNTIF